MARNRTLISDMLEIIAEDYNYDLAFNDLFPLHLAASYLSGAKSCCQVFDKLATGMEAGETSIRKLYTNHLNHTVLDNLMIAILKAHTLCTPGIVDGAFKKEHRFAGEEVDICGRWDADSDCIRQLQANGNPRIPQSWKHIAIWAPDINHFSGLFLRRCLNEGCGLKLLLGPLHTLVVTAVHLAQSGRDRETLFGIVACLLSLLGKGANPLLKADVSLKALLGDDDGQECTRSELDPFEFASSVPRDLISRWPEERAVGWKIFCAVLRLSQIEWDPPLEFPAYSLKEQFRSLYNTVYSAFADDEDEVSQHSDMNVDMEEASNIEGDDSRMFDYAGEGRGVPAYCPDHENTTYQQNYFGRNKNLATLWAAVQTELLTYRRLAEGDPWISENFDMGSVLNSLETGNPISIGLVSNKMMKPFCRCGIFRKSEDPACLRVEEACTHYFSNLEDWSRSTFIDAPEDRPSYRIQMHKS